MSYEPTGGVAERWTHEQVLAYIRKWNARGRSKKAIRNYLIAEDVCQSPDFKRQCAARLDAAYRVATSIPPPPMPSTPGPSDDGVPAILRPGMLRRYGMYAAVAGAGLVTLLLILRRRK